MRTLLVVSLLAVASMTSAQDVVIIIENSAGTSTPPPTIVVVPETGMNTSPPSAGAPNPYATPQVPGYDVQLRPPASIATSVQLQELQRQRPGLGGAISMMAGGFVTAGVGAWMATVFSWLDDWDSGGSDGPSGATIGMSVLSAAGFALAVGGVIKLIRNIRQRRRINRQIRTVQESLARPEPAGW